MKTSKIIYILVALITAFYWSCNEDLVHLEGAEEVAELKAKPDKPGKPGKPGEDTEGITITDLGTAGGDFSRAYSIAVVNGVKHIVGIGTESNGNTHALLWSESAPGNWQVHDLGYLHDTMPYSQAKAINSNGTIVGWSSSIVPPFYSNNAVTWSTQNPNTSLQDINPSSSVNSSGEAINNLGDIAGSRVDTCGYEGYEDCGSGSPGDSISIWSAFLWKDDGSYIDIGTLGAHSWALGINDDRIVVGYSGIDPNNPYEKDRAIVWENGILNIISGLEDHWSRANDINNAGQIVGDFDTLYGVISSSSTRRGFIAEKNEFEEWEYKKLPTLGKWTLATAISESGYVTGTSREFFGGSNRKPKSTPVAFLYHEDLNIPDSDNPDIISLGKYTNRGRSDGFDVIEDPNNENIIFVVGGGDVAGSRHALLWTIDLCELIPGRCPI